MLSNKYKIAILLACITGGEILASDANSGAQSEFKAFEDLLSDFDITPSSSERNTASKADPAPVELEKMAQDAIRQVSNLLSTSLARYSTPPSTCESERRVSNWVRIASTCQISIRRETNHNYLCGENKEPKPVSRTQILDVDFSRDVSEISEVKYAEDGSAILVLRLKSDIVMIEDLYKVDRWQFIAAQHVASDMESLSSSFLVLRNFCENKT